MAAYRFDPKEEAPTMLIQIQPHRYVTISSSVEVNKKGDFVDEGTNYAPTKKQEVGSDGKIRIVWDFETSAEVWVPPRIANRLIQSIDKTRPIAKLIATRTNEEADVGTDPRKAKKKRRRRIAETEEE